MPNWLYTYFGEVVKPLITMKEKRQLSDVMLLNQDHAIYMLSQKYGPYLRQNL